MKALTTPRGVYITSDEVADAVAEYALALAREQRVDAVHVPFVEDDGRAGHVRLTIGWGSDLDIVSRERFLPSDADAVVLDDLRGRLSSLYNNGDSPLSEEETADLRQLGEWSAAE